MKIKEIQKEVHRNAVDHGWWEKEPSFPEIIALIHSEASEALEWYRKGNEQYPDDVIFYTNAIGNGIMFKDEEFTKPDGIAIELADIVIRVMDYCEAVGICLEEAIRIKHEYNKSRPYKHGGKML